MPDVPPLTAMFYAVAAIAVIEFFLKITWVRHYYLLGVPLWRWRGPIPDGEEDEVALAELLEASLDFVCKYEFPRCSSLLSRAISQRKDGSEARTQERLFAVREQLFEFKKLTTVWVLRGIVSVSAGTVAVTVKVNYFPIALTGLLVFILLRPENLHMPTTPLVVFAVMVVVAAVQVIRYKALAQELTERLCKSRGS